MSLALGIDVGGTKILAGVVDKAGQILATYRSETPRTGGDELITALGDIVAKVGSDFQVATVGIAMAGFINLNRTKMYDSPNVAGVAGLAIHKKLKQRVALPLCIENDANAAAWAEARFGAGINTDPIIMLTIGTGIGGGMVINGNLHRGATGTAAEFGHMQVEPQGRSCGCGARGCFEQYASGTALVRYARDYAVEERSSAKLLLSFGDGTPEGIQGEHVTEAAVQGDPIALRAFATLGTRLGVGIAALAMAFNPDMFVLGGGVAQAGDLILTPTCEGVRACLPYGEILPFPKIVLGQLGNNAGVVGAADLSRQL